MKKQARKTAKPTPKPRTRADLEKQLQLWQKLAAKDTPPLKGWIREIRAGLGMTAEQLGQIMDIRQASVAEMEQTEMSGGIRLGTLRRAAKAMHCNLVYALVPQDGKSLESICAGRASFIATFAVMDQLRKQGVKNPRNAVITKMADAHAKTLDPHRIWDETYIDRRIREDMGEKKVRGEKKK